MAEFSLGLTKTAVEGTLSLVKTAVEEEKKLKEKVQNDLVFISGELEMMQSFLRVANNNKKQKNDDQVVLTWVRQLRTLAFDVEDCVENVVHLDLDSSRWGWLRRVWQTVNCRAPPLPLDAAVAEIKQLKARVEDVSQRNTRYNNNNKNNVVKYVVSMPPPPDDASSTYPSSSAPALHILRDVWEATGQWRRNMCNLQQELLIAGPQGEADHDLRVISVWGSSGGSRGGAAATAELGTASIFRKAYCDPKICERFRSRAWVKLTHPFNHDEFAKSLLAQLCATSQSHQANDAEFITQAGNNLMTRAKQEAMMQQMTSQRYLVVLEDVLTVAEWDVIRMYLPDSNKGSRILLSTPQLAIALHCTGEPYQVSELRKFPGDNRFLCAFFQNKTSVDIGEFYCQLRRGRVISVWGPDGDDKSNLVDILYKGIINGWFKNFEGVLDADKADPVGLLRNMVKHGVEFKRHSWVDVPDPLDLKVFARRLFLNFYSDDIRADKITEGGKMGEEGLVKWCRKYLFEKEDCLVVINGLHSIDDWDLIKSNLLSSSSSNNVAAAKGVASCIIVVTNEETVARQCVKDQKYQAFNVKDLEADRSISTLVNKGSWYYGVIRGMKGSRLLYDRRKDAIEWTNTFKFKTTVGGNNLDDEEFGVFTVMASMEKIYDDITARCILRHAYFTHAFQQIKRRSWVHAQGDFNLTDFSWCLLLDFYSDDPQAKEAVAVDLMEGTITNPIQKCREILRNEKCLVVIHDLWYLNDWKIINDNFFFDSEHTRSIIIVDSFLTTINAHCSPKVLRLGTQQQGFTDDFNKEIRSSFYTERCQKAWTHIIEPHVGRHRELMHLHFDKPTVFSVWGIAGVGKSSLVKTFYYKEMFRSASPLYHSKAAHSMTAHSMATYLYRIRISFKAKAFGWVDVPSPFDLTEFAWRLLLDLYSDHPQAKQTATISSCMTEEGQDPILECCKILQEINCLVVIDGLCSTQDWDLIKATFLPEPVDQRTAIVVIAIEEKVAMHCVQNFKQCVLNVRRLEADAALHLFQKIASKDKPLTPRDAELSKSIVAKCGGLHKVIATIGEVCRSRRWLEVLNHNNFMGTLETDPEFHGLRPMFSWMQSYFDAFSYSLKPCIFYLSIFSTEKNIRLRRLVCRWIAEGYCRDTSDGITCEENGGKFISELVNLSIIQESPSSKAFCEINGFFHEYIISRPMEDNLVFALEGRCSLNSTRGGQHLTIRSSWDRNEVVYESIDFSRLRSLTVLGEWKSFFICSKRVNMRLLRVLDLEDATHVTNEDLEQITKLLTRLKFLSLRRCREITSLPSSIGGLRQLQTLDIRHTCVVTLPLFITKLEKLRYLRAGTNEAWDWEGDVLLPPADGEDRAAAAAAQVTSLAATAITPTEGGRDDSTASSSAQAATPTPTPTEGGTNSTAPVVLAPNAGNNRPPAPTLVPSFLSKLCRRGGGGHAAGVTVPADIGKLAVLHTLGVVRVNGNKAIFQELKKLTQLRKLGVSGINKRNIKDFCSAVSGHAHLESLSVELDKDYTANLDELDGITQLVKPEELNLSIRRKLKLDMTIAKPEEFPNPQDEDKILSIHHLRIRPIQDGELHIGLSWREARVVEIQCSSVLHINFRRHSLWAWQVQVLKVHFSGGSHQSSLQISGLEELYGLMEVWLKGYSDEHRRYMQRQIKGHCRKPVLKLVQTHSC